jgi:hypothetical protein
MKLPAVLVQAALLLLENLHYGSTWMCLAMEYLHSVDWSTGLGYWNGVLNWSAGGHYEYSGALSCGIISYETLTPVRGV